MWVCVWICSQTDDIFLSRVTFPDVLDLNHFVDGDTGMRGEEGGDKPASGVDDSSTTDSGSALDAEDASLENTSASLPESDNQVWKTMFMKWNDSDLYLWHLVIHYL